MNSGGQDDDDLSLGGPDGDSLDDDDLLEGARRTRRVTFRAPVEPLLLPGEEGPAPTAPTGASSDPAPSARSSASPRPISQEPRAGYDGWMADRLRRSSLPPAHASAIAASTVPPPPPTPVPAPPEVLDSDDALGGALDLVTRSTKSSPVIDLTNEMAERLALDDFSGALRAAELLLGQDPENETAQHYASVSRERLEAMLLSRLQSQGQVPEQAATDSEIRWLGLDVPAQGLLARVDGHTDVDTVVSGSGMTRLEALRTLVELVEAKVIRFR